MSWYLIACSVRDILLYTRHASDNIRLTADIIATSHPTLKGLPDGGSIDCLCGSLDNKVQTRRAMSERLKRVFSNLRKHSQNASVFFQMPICVGYVIDVEVMKHMVANNCNSLAPGRCGHNFKIIIFKLITLTCAACKIVARWIPHNMAQVLIVSYDLSSNQFYYTFDVQHTILVDW